MGKKETKTRVLVACRKKSHSSCMSGQVCFGGRYMGRRDTDFICCTCPLKNSKEAKPGTAECFTTHNITHSQLYLNKTALRGFCPKSEESNTLSTRKVKVIATSVTS